MDAALYGPNSRLVERFIARLSEAPVEHWCQAVDRATAGLEQRRAAAERTVGHTRERDAAILAAAARLDEIARNVAFRTRHTAHLSLDDVVVMCEVAGTAVWALVMRDRLEPADFAILYWPFEVAFPVTDLEAAR